MVRRKRERPVFPARRRWLEKGSGKAKRFVEINLFAEQMGMLIICRAGKEGTVGEPTYESPDDPASSDPLSFLEDVTGRLVADGYRPVWERDTTDDELTAEFIKQRYGIEVPAAFRKLLDSGELVRFNGCFISGLPTWGDDIAFPVKLNSGMHPFLHDWKDETFSAQGYPNHLPLTLITLPMECLTHFLAVDLGDKKMPVSFWTDSAGENMEAFPTLNAFLGALQRKK